MRVIVECGGNPLLVSNYFNRYGLGLAAMEGLLLNMRAYRQSDSHGALRNFMSQGVVT